MRRRWLPHIVVSVIAMTAVWAQSATANPPARDSFHVDETSTDSGICDFNVRSHFSGNITVKSYYDKTGSLYRTIAHAGPGPFTVTASAKGTTLTQRNVSFTEVITYDADGSVRTITNNGPYNKFTAPGSGVVWLDTGHLVVDGDFNILFVAGPRQNGEFDEFCAVFG